MPYADIEEYKAYQKQYGKKNRKKLSADNRVWRRANLEKRTTYMRLWRKNSPEKTLLARARARAKKHGIPFSLTLKDIIIPKYCPYFGTTLKIADGRFSDDSPSLDKILPALGYVPGNVEVISWKANRLKGDGTAEEHRVIAERMLRIGTR